jgi:hypothetical protein
MDKIDRSGKKPYRRPALHRYGDLRALTRGSIQKKDEANTIQGPKTRAAGGP